MMKSVKWVLVGKDTNAPRWEGFFGNHTYTIKQANFTAKAACILTYELEPYFAETRIGTFETVRDARDFAEIHAKETASVEPSREWFEPVEEPNVEDFENSADYEAAWNAWTEAEDEFATACAIWQEEKGDG